MNAFLMKLSPTQRSELRDMTVCQQERFIGVREAFSSIQSSRLNPDFALDLEFNCLISDRGRRFIRRRGSMRHHNGGWKRTPYLKPPLPVGHSKSMGIIKTLHLPTLLPPEAQTLRHKKWLRDGFGLILTKKGVGAHIHPLKMAAHVIAEARLSDRLKPLRGSHPRHVVQLYCLTRCA